MKVNIFNIGGEVVKQDERYIVVDNKSLKNLILSSTVLHRDKSTSGHRHAGQEEVYVFVQGQGEMELDGNKFTVRENDIVLVEDGVFHKVHNTGDIDLIFVCVFDGKRNH